MTNPISIKKTAFDDIGNPEHLATAKTIQMKLTAIGFLAAFTHVVSGPVVTTYFFKPLPTSPLAKVMSKEEDIALAVGVESVLIQRILDEISIAVPNRKRDIILFDNCLFNMVKTIKEKNLKLPLLMGKNSMGDYISLDLFDQPHILIAGSTGSGKSVFLSELICSLAVMKDPKELKFILVDTKQLELTLFKDLEHTIEIIDKIDQLYKVLETLIGEVRRRTELMKGSVRNIDEWNKLWRDTPRVLPYIILVIDELADVISQDKEVAKNEDKENKRTRISVSLATLAQISRAAGVHIIAATQRPSVKILSGDIKVNFPARISFKLPSGFDSRVILDESGAEMLLGKGDYLYRDSSNSQVNRGHGAFVSIEDIKNILKQHNEIRRSFECI